MDTHFSSLSSKKYVWLLIILVALISIYCFYKPLVISSDSVYGFLAYKGTFLSHSFNKVVYISPKNISQTYTVFESWWSPGQWIYPGLLNYFFATRLGVASIIITLLSSILGFWGYYKLFLFFKFPSPVIIFSLLLIFCSCTFYYSFIIYQGGETLEFAFFPWFLFYILRIEKVNFYKLLMITLLFVLCYVAKTTLTLYCSIILAYKSIQPALKDYIKNREINLTHNSLLLLFPLVASNLIVQYFFLLKGPRIGFFNHFKIYAANFLVPLTAPLTSILSIQQWMHRIEKIASLKNHAILFANSMYLLALIAVIIIAVKIYRQRDIETDYKWLLLFLYVCLSFFFIAAYCFEANIDFSSRHFKLLGFLFIPAAVRIIYPLIKSSFIPTLILLCCVIAIVDIVYLKQKWTAERYISINYFYRNNDNMQATDSMDEITYNKLIDLDKSISMKDSLPAIFYIEANNDVEMDIKHLCITQKFSDNQIGERYYGNEAVIIACITKKTLALQRDLLKIKFPEYNNIQLADETNGYSFFKLIKN